MLKTRLRDQLAGYKLPGLVMGAATSSQLVAGFS